MDKQALLKQLEERIFVLDGAMGTSLQKLGFTKGCPDELNLTNPEIIKSIHKSYSDAGADIIITNTFGANRLKLSKYKLQDKLKEINEAGVKLAKTTNCLVAGDIGPLGEYLEPIGKLTFDEAYSLFSEQVKSLKEADLLIIETMDDIKMLRAAVIAAKENSNLPIIASMTFDGLRTTTGTDVKTFAAITGALGADIIGSNCGAGPQELYEVAKILVNTTNKPIIIQPNAGLPQLINGQTVFTAKPRLFNEYAKKFHKLGVNIIGGCCGTTNEHIAAIVNAVKNLKPLKRAVEEKTRFCSRTKTVELHNKTIIVGERINPTKRKDMIEEMKQYKTNRIRQEAIEQVKEGAALLDVNVGIPGIDEPKIMAKAVSAIQSVVDAPLLIDTSSIKALEEALKQSDGKPIINSVNGRDESINSVLPLAKKYGAAVIALTLEKKIPSTVEERTAIAEKIIKKAYEFGINKQDIVVDCLTLTIATNPENERIVIDAVKKIKSKGYKTILGVSNISHGMPNRSIINSKFLTKASQIGLDMAIINPLDNIMQKDTNIEYDFTPKIKAEDYRKLPIEKQIYNAILYGDKDNIVGLVNKALKNTDFLKINNITIDALGEVGDKFKKKIYFLPQVLLSAGAMKLAFNRLKKEFAKKGHGRKGKIVFATVENDIHDIGKNIVIALLESYNYEVIDLGTDVPMEKVINEAVSQKADIIALSALMTTTASEMERFMKELKDRNIKLPVIIGGAVITKEYADSIKAGYGKDALDAVEKISKILENGKNN